MQFAFSCVFLLTVCSSLAIAAHHQRVVLMIPKQIRRSPVAPWQGHHMRPSQFRKSHYGAEEEQPHFYNRPNNIIYGKHTIRPNINHLPHGGDDFDQDHDGVNNIVIPHGKGISHGISFGRGYIPYDRIKGNNSPVNEDHSSTENHNHDESSEDESSFSPADPSHVTLTSNSDTDSFYRDQSGAYQSQINGKIKNVDKNLYSRSIQNNFGSKNSFDSTNIALSGEEKPSLQVSPDSSESHDFSAFQLSETESTSTSPIIVPSVKIGGSTHGVIIRDSISLDDYNQKVEEFTKSWPGVVNIPGIHGSNLAAQTIQQLPASAFSGSSFPAASPWRSSFAQGRQSYAVKEDLSEPQIDFRTMNFQNSQFQHTFPIPGNANLPNIQTHHG
ncbi:uncharacterized protein LOC117177129 [Belonocnema kinseyi]|uniref:uncharacterized protein LOC117177129 n=1 Tax=Belonocnema kinseyi TaxID=2817044 RepID=UPI00143D23F9|nr:uncharacterized protein LOC117177129 [Belonocnema kinseyi]